MKRLLFLCCALLIGCASLPEQDGIDIIQPTLVEQAPLPVVTFASPSERIFLHLTMLVDETGDVKMVRLDSPTGNLTWDSLAIETILKWKYTPALFQGRPLKVWVQQLVVVELVDPVYLYLSEIVCDSQSDAEKLLDSLKNGTDFGTLALQYSKSESSARHGYIGRMNINSYPGEIREKLSSLLENEYTQPLKMGSKYIIFKRALLSI
jgi:hypothetical protein